jgi:hypothetical protein
MNNSEKIEIINQTLTKLYNRLQNEYTADGTLKTITSIKELELLKVALEMGNNDLSIKNSPQNRPQVR